MTHPSHHFDQTCSVAHESQGDPRGSNVLQCLIIIVWGCVMVYFYESGRIEHYLTDKGSFRLQCLLGGLGLVILGSINLWFTLSADAFKDHDGSPGTVWTVGKMLVLVVPLTLAVLGTSDRYSDAFLMRKFQAAPPATASAAARPGGFSINELERLCGGRTVGGDIPLGLEQVWQLASQPDDVRAVIESVRIETVGQIVRDPTDPTRWKLSRLVITCCAADARGVAIALAFDGDPSEWQALGWYRTVGRVALDSNGVPVFKVESVTPAEPQSS